MATGPAECTPRAEKMQIRKKPAAPAGRAGRWRLPTVTMRWRGSPYDAGVVQAEQGDQQTGAGLVMPTRRVRGMLATSQ